MTSIAIVFHSATGTTEQLAQAVQQGVAAAGCQGLLLPITGQDIVDGRYHNPAVFTALDRADAIIFGSPTFMGGTSAQFKAFADASSERWETQVWQDKLAAGFTIGSNLNGDQSSTLHYLAILAAQHGMLWVGVNLPGNHGGLNRLGVQLGVSAQTSTAHIPAPDLQTAQYLGARVARLANRLRKD
jgi:NAD(P)H dehydrogenase (quinone)